MILTFSISLPLIAADAKKETTDAEDTLIEFKETKFLQIDQLDVPKELERIEAQIRQNALDVIISSKTHTPVYAQKVADGYSDSYKKFHGLKIQIVPIPNEQDFYSLTFQYYNWTNRKFDKSLRRRISKYNVLNELRFGLYELLLGKKFVDDHKDEIEKQNYDRIQAVRENEEKQARIDRKKKKLMKKKEKDEEIKLILQQEEEEKKKSKLSRGEDPKKDKSLNTPVQQDMSIAGSSVNPPEDSEIEDIDVDDPEEVGKTAKISQKRAAKKKKSKKSNQTSQETTDVPALVQEPEEEKKSNIPTISKLYAFASFFDESVTSKGLLQTSTHLKYAGFGARYINEQDIDRPRGMRFSLKVGLPIKKDNYQFPVYRSFETEIYKSKLLGHFSFFAGLDLTPVYFVNLATAGEGLTVFENDIFWLKGGTAAQFDIFGRSVDLRLIFLKSVMSKSNKNMPLVGTSIVLNLEYMHNEKHGGQFTYQKSELAGELETSSKSITFSYIYKFEN